MRFIHSHRFKSSYFNIIGELCANFTYGGSLMTLAEWFVEHPQLGREWDYEANESISPSKVGYSSKKEAWWICEKGHKWNYVINTR